MGKALFKKTIFKKMLFGVCLPVIIVCIVAIFSIISLIEKPLTNLTIRELTAKSQTASAQVSEFFNQYIEIANQMGTNYEIEQLYSNITPGVKITDAEGFANIKRTLDNVQQTDPEVIGAAWVADADSSQLAQSDGYISDEGWDIKSRPWYKEVMDSQSPIFTEPYVDTATQKTIVSAIAPVYQSGSKTIIGFVGIDFSIDNLYTSMKAYTLGETGFFMLASKNGQLIYHPDESMVGKNISEADMSENIITAIQNKQPGELKYTAMGQTAYGYLSAVGNTGWTVVSGLPEKEFNHALVTTRNTIASIFGIGILVLTVFIVLISLSIVKPLKKLKTVANRIADGELDVIVDSRSSDETGEVAHAIGRTVDRLKDYIKYIDEISEVLNQIAKGNLIFELKHDYAGEFAKIKESLGNIKSTLTQTVTHIATAADQVSSGSEQVSDGAQALAQGATEQASSIQELSATVTMIAEQTKQNAASSATASKKATQSGEEILRSNQKMQEMIEAMSEITETSNKIAKIIKTIEDIAFQTNILALNAAVEAARAGSAGKGFAVVADEVRNLASKSAQAAKNTTEMIEGSIKAVEKGTAIADSTAKAMLEAVESSKQTVQLIDEISIASNEQATAISQVTLGVEQISSVVQTNSATAEESAAASEELSSQAKLLKELMRNFTVETCEEDTASSFHEIVDDVQSPVKRSAYSGKY